MIYSMKNPRQSGFAHLAIIAAVAVVAVIAIAGYLVVKSGDKAPQNSPTAAGTSASTTATSKSKDEAAIKTAAKDHFALVYQKKFNEAYQSTCQGFKVNTTYAVFQISLGKAYFSTIDLSAVEYTSVDVRNNQAQISGLIGPVVPDAKLKVNLLKENSQWCVFGYKIE